MKKIQTRDKVLINRIHYPVKALGFGNRIGIWFQGCTIHCKGCMSKYTWAFDSKYAVSYKEVFNKLFEYSEYKPYGITISGGEPFDQPESLLKILEICSELKFDEIMVYSGYKFDYLSQKYSNILDMIDLLISEPFIESLPTNKIWRGSDNQKIHLLSNQTKERYKRRNLDSETCDDRLPIQIEVSSNSIFVMGIPRRGDLKKVRQIMRKKGAKIW